MTQSEMVLEYIEDFGSITTYEAFIELGITRLSARIFDLKKKGYNFKKTMIKKKNRYGKKIKFYKYELKECEYND